MKRTKRMKRPDNVTTADIKEALMIAREGIKSGWHEFICHALPETPTGDYLRGYICSAIQEQTGYSHLNAFIYRELKDIRPVTAEAMKEYRLRYIDWMLDQ